MRQLLNAICFHFLVIIILSNSAFAQDGGIFNKPSTFGFSGLRLSEQFFYNFDTLQYNKYFSSTNIEIPLRAAAIPFSFNINILESRNKESTFQTLEPTFTFDFDQYEKAKVKAFNLSGQLSQEEQQKIKLNNLLGKKDSLLRIIKNPYNYNNYGLSTRADSLENLINNKAHDVSFLSSSDSILLEKRSAFRSANLQYTLIKDSIYQILRNKKQSDASDVANDNSAPSKVQDANDSTHLMQETHAQVADSQNTKLSSEFERFITHFESIKIGKSYVDNSGLTLQDYPIFGGSFVGYLKPFYFSFATGNETFEERNIYFNPTYPNNTSVVFLKAGLGSKNESHTHISYVQFSGLPQSNVQNNIKYASKIVSLELNRTSENGDFIETEFATSILSASQKQVSEKANALSSSSVRVNFNYTVIKLNLNLSGMLVSTGQSFSTWGNKYLMPGSNAFDLHGQMDVTKRLKVEYMVGYFNQAINPQHYLANRISHSLSTNYAISGQQSIYMKLSRSSTNIHSGVPSIESFYSSTELISTAATFGYMNTDAFTNGNNLLQANVGHIMNQTFMNGNSIHDYYSDLAFANYYINRTKYSVRARASVITSNYSTYRTYRISGGGGASYHNGKKWLCDLSADVTKDEYDLFSICTVAMIDFSPNSKWKFQQQLLNSSPLVRSYNTGTMLNRLTYRFALFLSI